MSHQEENPDSTAALFARYVMPNYGRFPLALERGEGSYVWDEDGKKYLDMGAGIAVCSLGHCHPAVTGAIREQAETLVHCSNLYKNRGQGLLAELISEKIVGAPGKSFFCNSGAEANEALMKLARKYGHVAPMDSGAPRIEIITFEDSFHGRTFAGISATAQTKAKKGFEPLLPGFKHLPFNDVAALRAGISADTVAILLEPVQGEGGINVATPEFLACARDLCAKHDLLLLFDEVQCGVGRTGHLCGWRSIPGGDAIEPDAISWAKGFAGGVPAGAIWVRSRSLVKGGEDGEDGALSDLLGPGTHGSTFGGNPLVSAAALAALEEIMGAGLCENAVAQGEYLRSGIASWESGLIREVRGLGLMLGIVLDMEAMESVPGFAEAGRTPSLFMVDALMEKGLLTVPAGADVVRLLPPLNLSSAEADEALALIRSVVQDFEMEGRPLDK